MEVIKAPTQQPQANFNRKNYTIVLACCNSKMEFTYASTGNPGSTHDAPVLRYSDLFQNSDNIPSGYCILGDSAFPIMEWLRTPIPRLWKL